LPNILSYKKFCEELPLITSSKVFSKKRFHPNGLFSEQIFGPIKNYTCQCDNKYHGASNTGSKCDKCEIDIVHASERRKRFAKILLPIPVVNPIIYDLISMIGGKPIKDGLDNLMKNEKSILYIDRDDIVITLNADTIPKNTKRFEKLEAIQKYIEFVCDQNIQAGNSEWKIVKDSIEDLLISYVIVLPPDLRPTSKHDIENKQLMDQINRYYVQILMRNELINNTVVDINKDKNIFYSYFRQLQKDVRELYDHIMEKIAKKEGLIRGNILGKRIDFSGRAVITPDPTIELDECVLPYLMVLEIFKLDIAKKLIEIGRFKILNKALDYIDDCIEFGITDLFSICEDIIQNQYCLLNRQPTLHRLGMLGFKIKISCDKVIKVHPLICNPFNADFDGDQMAVYIPISEESRDEIKEKMLVTKHFNSPANNELTTTPSQDIILGIYSITSNLFPGNEEQEVFKEKLLKRGEIEFNNCLPEDYQIIYGVVDKKRLISILNDIKNSYNEEITKECLDKIKRIGFKYSTLIGYTMALDFLNDELIKHRDKIYAENKTVQDLLSALNDKNINNLLREGFKYAYMIDSGARGSWDQAKQLIFTRGFISNFNGEILPLPIKHNLMEGLTQEEFFYSSYGCRKGLLDVALNTGTSGYLSRKLIFTCANLQIDSSLDDCGTKDFLSVLVNTERKAKMLIGRWFEDGENLSLISNENYKSFIGKEIKLRSPIYCKTAKICHKCYGQAYKIMNSRFIGIIAAQALGERATQLVLRTFHTSGAAVVKGEEKQKSLIQQDIIGDLSTVSSMLHKFDNKTAEEIVHELFSIYDKDIFHVHFECVVSQLMWVGNKKWRLHENRSEIRPSFFSVQSVPNQESWILAMAFSNPKKSILNGIINKGQYSGILDKILKGNKI